MTIADSTQPAPTDNQRRLTASIVIPVHNKATITRQCLDALLAEPNDGIDRQLVVVDDGSTDMTPSLLAQYSDRILVIRNETALGFAGACNAGVAAATGEFVVLLNNDTVPTSGWLSALVNYAVKHPAAAVVGAKLLFPNDTIQHAGVAIGLDSRPHHIYAGFPADHPATSVSRRFQVVTAACALFCRGPWQELGGLDVAFQNGWEDVDYCLRAGEAGYEVHYCAESVVYHFESATRNLVSDAERANQELFATRWRHRITPDDYRYYWQDGLLSAQYGARYPIRLSVSPLLAGVTVGDNDRLADRLLYDRARQVMILLRNNIVLNVRVQEAEARAAESERRLAEIQMKQPATGESGSESDPSPDDGAMTPNEPTTPNSPSSSDEPSSEAQPTLPHRIVGMVESPGRIPEVITDGVLTVSGWALTEAGDATIEVLINGVSRGTVTYGDPRPDAAALYPGFPAGASCGFLGEIGVGDLSDGMHESSIRISASNGAQAELTTSFEIDNHAFETGRVIGRLDQPHRGAIFIPRESIVVSGWVLAPSGIERIEAFVDGEARGRIDHRVLRPDIAKRRRQYADADHCGFSGTVPLFGLTEGSHELLVLITANDGRQLEMPTRIEVEAPGTVDGGLPIINRHYRAWLERRAAHDGAADEADQLASRFSCEVIVALDDDCEDALEPIVASMRAQAHQNWRLALVDSGTASDSAREYARHLAREDGRISYRQGGESGNDGFVDAVNAVIAESSADWNAILPSGIILSPNALSSVARAATANPETLLIYSDDDRIDPETLERWNPFFKPDWSPDLLVSMNYLGPLVVFHRRTVLDVGGLRAGVSGAEVYDLALRVTDRSDRVHHVPEVLATTIATAPGAGASWHASDWRESERQAIADALARREVNGIVERGLHPGTWRVRYALPDPPAVTAVIPTGGKLDMLRPCLDDLMERTDYPNLDILLVDNSNSEAVERLVAELSPRFPGLRRLANPLAPFNYSALVNSAIPHVTAPFVLMLNDDITAIDPGWLRAMVELAQRPEVGIVGAKLLYPDDTIQHAGVVLGPFGGSVHVFKRLPGDDPGFFDLPDVVRNVSAVTFACAVIDRKVFDVIGGLDEENLPVAFNDTDFCLRTREAGYEVLYTPHATLHHHESVTKVVIAHPHEIEFLRERWGHVIDHDPYYNPNLTRQGEDARLNMEVTSAV